MKLSYFILFNLVSILFCSLPNDKLKLETKKLYDANYHIDIDEITNLTYPKVYESIGKEEFKKKQDELFQNEAYRYRLQLPNVAMNYGELIKRDNLTYCLITFKNPVRYFFEAQLSTEKATEKAEELKKINATKEVTFEPKRNSFNVKKTSHYIAIFDATTNNKWTFINLDDPFQRDYAISNLDASLKEKFGL
jgi:hypothetical protein